MLHSQELYEQGQENTDTLYSLLKWRQLIFVPADSKDNLYNPSDEFPLFNLPIAYTKHGPSVQQGTWNQRTTGQYMS